ncbi:28S ribosomal protein S35, mitochondrial [Diabrotica virgifera virgifera]|uniref:Small ribosomal subunit protein mS35 mitochondrial conserved domain-containing protein n=2 Tax=Diabrotica virgifera virgifera TaxID=50390 RepID=A0ABM5K8Q8_DIAVI|nr:28S ribosomal protein S35, mitochondrial [Diabrotica virgifera virgifera]
MLNCVKIIERYQLFNVEKILCCRYANTDAKAEIRDEFRALNIRNQKGVQERRQRRPPNIIPPRTNEMPVDQDWGNVWPGPRSFHPASVPLPVRQGYTKKGASPDKYANAELIKIPNFLHLTPPVIERQCKALKQFCTPWPKALDTDEKCEKHFPFELTFSDYCFSSPSIRNPLARIVTLRFKLKSLNLNQRANDKFLRLVGDRYDEATDTVTIVTDRCPLRKQNYDYALYLITALYHESWNVEPWEELKAEADMQYYDWQKNASKSSIEKLFGTSYDKIENVDEYVESVDKLMNEGENDYTVTKYGDAVRKLLGLPSPPSSV